jgi:hypothetical protein
METTARLDEQALVEAHLRRLSDDECAAFVADLWAARGYETRREGTVVTATRGTETLRIAVASVDDQQNADMLVSLDGSQPAPTGGRVVDAAGLAERLWYAVDRSVARELCERHLGAPPAALRPPLRRRLAQRLPTAPEVSVSATAIVVLLAIAVVALTMAGAPQGDGSPGDETPTATAVGSDQRGVVEQAFPPGVDGAGIRDLDALAAAHERMVSDRPVTIWVDQQRPDFANGWTIRTYDMDVASNGQQYRVDIATGERGNRTDLGTLYHDGVVSYARIVQDGNESYRELSPQQVEQSIVPTPSGVAVRLVRRYLSTPTTEMVGTVERDGQTLYRVVGTGQPDGPALRAVENYTVTADIAASGFVRNLTAEYTTVDGDRRYRLGYEVTYGRIDATTVTPPEWYVERFAGSDVTPTA